MCTAGSSKLGVLNLDRWRYTPISTHAFDTVLLGTDIRVGARSPFQRLVEHPLQLQILQKFVLEPMPSWYTNVKIIHDADKETDVDVEIEEGSTLAELREAIALYLSDSNACRVDVDSSQLNVNVAGQEVNYLQRVQPRSSPIVVLGLAAVCTHLANGAA